MGVVSVCGGWVLRGGVIGGWCDWGVVCLGGGGGGVVVGFA